MTERYEKLIATHGRETVERAAAALRTKIEERRAMGRARIEMPDDAEDCLHGVPLWDFCGSCDAETCAHNEPVDGECVDCLLAGDAEGAMELRDEVCDHGAEFWIDDSWAGPDSGGEGGCCLLCGWHFRVAYY
jgi:hypothetical protein